MSAIRLNHVTLMCYRVIYFILSLPHPYQHIQHDISMLIFNMVSELPSCGYGFLSLRYIQEQSLSSSMFFSFAAFIFFGFLLLPSKLSDIVTPSLKVASTLQGHCLPQSIVTKPNFIQGIFSILSNIKISLSFKFGFERGVRVTLAHQHSPKPNSTLCASQVFYLYQQSISLGFSLLYIHML